MAGVDKERRDGRGSVISGWLLLAGCLAAALWGCLGRGGGVPAMAVGEARALVRWADGGRHGARGSVALRGHSNLCAWGALEDYDLQAGDGHGARGDDGGDDGGEPWQREAEARGGDGGAGTGGGKGFGRGSEVGWQGRRTGWFRRVRTGQFGSGNRGLMQKCDAARGIWWRPPLG